MIFRLFQHLEYSCTQWKYAFSKGVTCTLYTKCAFVIGYKCTLKGIYVFFTKVNILSIVNLCILIKRSDYCRQHFSLFATSILNLISNCKDDSVCLVRSTHLDSIQLVNSINTNSQQISQDSINLSFIIDDHKIRYEHNKTSNLHIKGMIACSYRK